MEVNLNSVQSTNPATNASLTGVAAPQTEAQRADVSATRPVTPRESANLEDKASRAEESRYAAIRSKAASYVRGENSFLNDIKFTIYGANKGEKLNEYVIRFTDISTGNIEVKTEQELFAGTSGGNVVSGSI